MINSIKSFLQVNKNATGKFARIKGFSNFSNFLIFSVISIKALFVSRIFFIALLLSSWFFVLPSGASLIFFFEALSNSYFLFFPSGVSLNFFIYSLLSSWYFFLPSGVSILFPWKHYLLPVVYSFQEEFPWLFSTIL